MKKDFLFFVVWLAIVISFLLLPLTADFNVFRGYYNQVAMSKLSGIGALIDAWELKGLLFRAYIYITNSLVDAFHPVFDLKGHYVFRIISLTLYLLILALILLILPKNEFKKRYLFFIASILLISTHLASHFQPEMWANLFLLLSFALLLKGSFFSCVIGGFVYMLTFYIKSPIPLLGGTILFAYLLVSDICDISKNMRIRNLIYFYSTGLFLLVISLIFIKMLYPQELLDMWNASYYQHTTFHEFSPRNVLFQMIKTFFSHGLLFNPINILGVTCTAIILVEYYRKRYVLRIIYLLLIWFFPFLYIGLSNCYFIYHYYLLAFPSVISISLFVCLMRKRIKISKILKQVGVVYLFYYIFTFSAISPTSLYAKDCYMNMIEGNLKKGYVMGTHLGDGCVMYLDDGFGACQFGNESYLRYFYPLPLQRISADNKFTMTATYRNVKQKALNYNGTYLTVTEWFFKNGNDDIKAKIKKEYVIQDTILYCDMPRSLYNKEFKEEKIYIYKRKEI